MREREFESIKIYNMLFYFISVKIYKILNNYPEYYGECNFMPSIKLCSG